MKKSRKPKIGDLLRIVFYDHASGAGKDQGVLKFEALGRLMSESSVHYDLCHWGYVPEDKEPVDFNCEFQHIVKKAIISVEILK